MSSEVPSSSIRIAIRWMTPMSLPSATLPVRILAITFPIPTGIGYQNRLNKLFNRAMSLFLSGVDKLSIIFGIS